MKLQTKTPRTRRPYEVLLQAMVAALACSVGAASSSEAAEEESVEDVDYEDETTLRKLYAVLEPALEQMSGLERTSAISDLASEPFAECRLVAALCLQSHVPLVGREWCREALRDDPVAAVRKACDVRVVDDGPEREKEQCTR